MPFWDGKEIPPTSLFDIDATSKVLTVPHFLPNQIRIEPQ